ncbi:MAG: hypothetical protein UY04_C0008G0004 [Parcubacteria group bacterium GW2011_GWA2_47_7]|nr:MAG: hypothetical protein UY04_C0008G0004 [Parcubacteria group bacterium GW2011_GWA2_47_7]
MQKASFIFLIGVFAIADALFLYPKYQIYHDVELFAHAPEVVSRGHAAEALVANALSDGSISLENFTTDVTASNTQAFSDFYQKNGGAGLFRVKIWDANYRVLWSDLSVLNGQRFSTNDEVREPYGSGDTVIKGTLGVLIDEAVLYQKVCELYCRNFMEVYIPVKNENEVVGIVELYYNVQDVVDKLRGIFYWWLFVTSIGFFFTIATAYAYLWLKMHRTHDDTV